MKTVQVETARPIWVPSSPSVHRVQYEFRDIMLEHLVSAADGEERRESHTVRLVHHKSDPGAATASPPTIAVDHEPVNA